MNATDTPVTFNGHDYHPLTMEDLQALTERIPEELVPRQLLPFVSITETMRFARSPRGIGPLMEIVAERSGLSTDDLSVTDQLVLAGMLTSRFYGFESPGEDQDDRP